MEFPSYKKFMIKRKARSLLNSTKSVLDRKKAVIDPSVSSDARGKIKELEKALASDNRTQIETSYDDLKEFSESKLKKYDKSRLRQNIESVIIALALALMIRTFVVQPFKIPSGSMMPTLLIGDHLLVNKFVYGTDIPFTDISVFQLDDIDRGDVIVFKFPEDSENGPRKGVHYIKRVIGIEGDTVDIRGRDLYINGEKVYLEYIGNYSFEDNNLELSADMYEQQLSDHEFRVLYKKGSTSTTKGKLDFPVKIPEDNVFVMGDNRDNSYDSRFWGFVPVENISGKAFIIHWSWNFENGGLTGLVRWNRIFKTIN